MLKRMTRRKKAEDLRFVAEVGKKAALVSAGVAFAGVGSINPVVAAVGGAGVTMGVLIDRYATAGVHVQETIAKDSNELSEARYFSKARDLIDVEVARKVAEADGVKIVRPEDVQ